MDLKKIEKYEKENFDSAKNSKFYIKNHIEVRKFVYFLLRKEPKIYLYSFLEN